ncbi:MAG: hypothetical protein WCW52_05480 [Elusimicrobiales bacterium]|jgi:hypothetical protein
MNKKIFLISGMAATALAALGLFGYLNHSMNSAEVIRKLSGIRMAGGLFRLEKGRPPSGIGELISSGNLEAAPELKLRMHRTSSKVRNASVLTVADTGGWAYVNDPKSPDYGTFFIDCSHTDEKDRYWSWF